MSKLILGSISAVAFLVASAAVAPALDISAKKILIKDNPDPTKRQVLILSKDVLATYASADTPSTGGAAVHVYGSTTADDFCAIIGPGILWKNLTTKWKYVDPSTKNSLQIKDGKLLVKIKQDAPVLDYTLADNAPPGQGAVNVQVQFGTGTRFCMRCGGTIIKDDGAKFLGKDCPIAACDPEPTTCDPPNPTTTSTSSTTSTTLGSTLKAVLPATGGRFNFNLTLGLPGANAACNAWAAHACELTELQALPTSELTGITDTNGMTVTSFWGINSSADAANSLANQCADDAAFPMPAQYVGHKWEYGTAHTPSKGQKVPLDNGTGVLGAIQPNQACAIGGTASWVGCCQ